MIQYFPELEVELCKLGLKSSTAVFTFLKESGIDFFYDRAYVKALDEDVRNAVDEFKKLYCDTNGFVFHMQSPQNLIRVDVIFVELISKDKLLKALELKAFS